MGFSTLLVDLQLPRLRALRQPPDAAARNFKNKIQKQQQKQLTLPQEHLPSLHTTAKIWDIVYVTFFTIVCHSVQTMPMESTISQRVLARSSPQLQVRRHMIYFYLTHHNMVCVPFVLDILVDRRVDALFVLGQEKPEHCRDSEGICTVRNDVHKGR